MYRLINLSRAPWDLVPSKARENIEWRVKGLPTYLVHGSQEKFDFLCFYLFLKNSFITPIISSIKLELQAISSEAQIFCSYDKKRMSLNYFTCVLRTHFKEELDILIIYSVIKKNGVIPAYTIWISVVGMNDVNNDVDRSKDIYSWVHINIDHFIKRYIELSGY